MDFDRYLTRVQTILMSIEKTAGIKFTDITRENDEELDSVVQSFLSSLKDLNANSVNLRRIHLFLLINSDFESVRHLHNDINYCHLVGTVPRISTVLYFELMNATDMYKYIGEVVTFFPEVFAVDVLKCLTLNLKYVRAEIANEFLSIFFKGYYKKIVSLQEQSDVENIKQKYVKIFQNMFEFSVFEIIDRTTWELEKRQCFFGRYIKMILNMIESCIGIFTSGSPIEQQMDLYKMKIEYDYKSWGVQTKEYNWPVYCLQVMISKCKRVLKEVNVDIYMAWCEEDYKEGKAQTLQTVVRESAYTCREALHAMSKYEEQIVDLSFLIKGLDSMALKPKSEDDEIDQADSDAIARNMKDPKKTQLKWLKTYLSINNILLENRCVDDLKSVISIFTKALTLQLIGTFTKHLAANEIPDKSVEPFKVLILSCVRQLNMEEQLEILNTVSSKGSDMFKTSNFNHSLTETFNKLVHQNEKMEKVIQDVVILAMESGRELVSHLLADCLKGANLCDLLIQVLVEIPLLTKYPASVTDSTPLCLHLTIQLFDSSLQSGLEERDSLVHMIKKLSWFSIINGKHLVIDHFIPLIQESVTAKKWKDIDLCLDVLAVFVDGSAGDHAGVDQAEIIAFLAQVLNRSRLQPPQFTVHSANVMQKTVQFIFTLTNSFVQRKNGKTDKEVSWLKEVASSLSPMSWFPMRKLWSGMELPPDPNNTLAWSKQYLGRKDLLNMNEDDRASFVIQLCKILPLLCQSEWKMIGFELGGADKASHCVVVFHILADCLLVLNQLPVVYGNPACMAHLISGFTTFFKAKVFNALKHSDRDTCLSAINKQVLIANDLGAEVLKVRLAALVSVLQDMAGLVLEKAAKDQKNSDLIVTVTSIKEPQIQSMLSTRLIKILSA